MLNIVKKKYPFATKIICFYRNIPQKTRKYITLANCSSSVGYTRFILCYVSAEENSKIKPAFTKYGAKHTQCSSIRILLPSMSEMPECKQLRRVFFLKKGIQVPARVLGRIYSLLRRRSLHIENATFHALSRISKCG